MTQQYRYNTETEQFIEDKGNLGISFYEAPWVEATQVQAKTYELQQAKDSKLAQMKINRDANMNKDHISSQGLEVLGSTIAGWTPGDYHFFDFSVRLTSVTTTNPSDILGRAKDNFIAYLCKIKNGDGFRKGFIDLNCGVVTSPETKGGLVNDLQNHMEGRTQLAVEHGFDLEKEINACTTIEEVNAIDINFDY